MGGYSIKIKKLKKMDLASRQKVHFDIKRARIYEDAHDYRAKTFDWMVKTITPYLIHTESVLDIGCGTGDLIRTIKSDCVFTGIDVSESMIEIAKEKCPNGRFILGNAYFLPFGEEKFEAIIYKYALHHFDRPIKSLKEAYRVLKDNGIIVIADVDSFENKMYHSIFKKLNRMREPANYEYRAIGIIVKLLRKAGFKDEKIVKKNFTLVLEDWLNCFYESEKTIKLVLNSPLSFRNALKLKPTTDKKHKITLTSFVIIAKK